MDKSELEEGKTLAIQFQKRGGLVPVVVQDQHSKEILMLGYSNKEAFELTQKKGLVTLFSTSRNQLWTKGETSGDFLKVLEIRIDCDQDALLYLVETLGDGACHTINKQGAHRKSCFYRTIDLNSEVKFLEK